MGQEQKEHTWDLIAKKLTGEASFGELKELEDLLRAHPELYYPLQTIADFWKSSNPGDRIEAELALDRHLDRIKDRGLEPAPNKPSKPNNRANHTQNRAEQPHRRSRALLWITPILLVLLAICIFYRPSPSPKISTGKDVNEVATHIGSRTTLVLPDGTQVWLNAGTRLTYDKSFGIKQREVLLTGEALFDVAHNAVSPFVIHAAHIDIRVLGTRLNVKSYPADKTTETTLLKGSIEVSIKARPDEKIILKPNEKLVIANDDSALHRNLTLTPRSEKLTEASESLVNIRKPGFDPATGLNIETSWAEDRLIFQDEPFGQLATDMQRWYGVSIRFTRPDQEKWRFTGNFQKETIQQALEALKLTAPFTYTITENQITIYDK